MNEINNSQQTQLIVDGNWLMMRQFAVLRDKHFITGRETPDAQTILCNSFIDSIWYTYQQLNDVITNIVVVRDSGSWRKALYADYKANRVRDDKYNWRLCFDTFDTMIRERLAMYDITCCSCRDAEGDDLMYELSNKNVAHGVNTIVWTADRDLQQIVRHTNDAFVFVMNHKNIIHIDVDDTYTCDVDFFIGERVYPFTNIIERIKSHGHTIARIEPYKIAIEKIVCGDKSDNYPSIAMRTTKSRTFSLNESIVDAYIDANHITSFDEFDKCASSFFGHIASLDKYDTLNIDERYALNVRLALLSHATIPHEIIERIDEIEITQFDAQRFASSYMDDASFSSNDVVFDDLTF